MSIFFGNIEIVSTQFGLVSFETYTLQGLPFPFSSIMANSVFISNTIRARTIGSIRFLLYKQISLDCNWR
jgi:hypothetical protein